MKGSNFELNPEQVLALGKQFVILLESLRSSKSFQCPKLQSPLRTDSFTEFESVKLEYQEIPLETYMVSKQALESYINGHEADEQKLRNYYGAYSTSAYPSSPTGELIRVKIGFCIDCQTVYIVKII